MSFTSSNTRFFILTSNFLQKNFCLCKTTTRSPLKTGKIVRGAKGLYISKIVLVVPKLSFWVIFTKFVKISENFKKRVLHHMFQDLKSIMKDPAN